MSDRGFTGQCQLYAQVVANRLSARLPVNPTLISLIFSHHVYAERLSYQNPLLSNEASTPASNRGLIDRRHNRGI
jgi:hypothetical protein